MAFCNFSTEFVASSQTEVDNIFINDYLPSAPSDYVKVYLFGLYMCKNAAAFDNSLENFAKRLNMTEEDIETAFYYWEEQGLVQVLRTYPIEVRFVPLKNIVNNVKLFKPEKYESFNSQVIELFSGKREVTKTEFGEYYEFLERFHVEQEALLMIIKYCIDSKKSGVGYRYILTVAKNWANEGVTTAAQVEEKLISFEQKDNEIGQIIAALGIKRVAYIEERNLANKWLIEMGFSLDTVIYIAKDVKKRRKANFNVLDAILTHYYELKLMTILEIEEFEANKKNLCALAKSINKAIGVYYESLDSEIEDYILKWINYGFDEDVLVQIARYCFKNSIRTLAGMNEAVQKFYKLGILTSSALSGYINGIIEQDSNIQSLLTRLGIDRKVNFIDRENFKTWTENWNLPQELIDYGATIAAGKNMPMQYLSKILADWHDKGIKNVDDAKKSTPQVGSSQTPKENFQGRSYGEVDASTLFDYINEVEL